MKLSPPKFLAVVLAVAVLAVVFQPSPEPDAPADLLATGTLAEGWPETAALRVVAKRLVVREAAAGRWSLFEAAALFDALNRLPPEVVPARFDNFLNLPGRSDEERLCLSVISHSVYTLSGEPTDQAQAARLETEYLRALRESGGVRLSDPHSLPSARELLERARASMTDNERRSLLGSRSTRVK